MNNEIKEILEYWKFYINEPSNYKLLNVHFDEIKKVLDYITNLQQAIEVKNERIKEEQQEKERYIKFYNELNIWNKELQQENENLKEKCDYLERSNNRRKDEIMSLRDECVDGETYKSRNEKAVEYINHENFKRTILVGVGTKKYTRNILNNVLNILQGSDNNER